MPRPTRFRTSIAGKFVLFSGAIFLLGGLMVVLTYGFSSHARDEAARLENAGRLRADLLSAASQLHFIAADTFHFESTGHEARAKTALEDYERHLKAFLEEAPGAGVHPFPEDHVGLRGQAARLSSSWRDEQRAFYESLIKRPGAAAESCGRCHEISKAALRDLDKFAASIEIDHRRETETASKLKSMLVVLFCVLAVLLVAYGWRRIVIPIGQLTDAATRLGQGDFGVRAEVGGSDEIGALSRSFNEMAGRLQAQLRDLQRSSGNFRSIFEGASDGIFISSPAGRYLDVNRRGLEMLGYMLDEMRTLDVSDVVDPDDPPPRLDDLRAGKTVATERRLRRKDGTKIFVEVSARALPDGRLIAIVRDVTERRASLEQIVHLSSFPQLNPNPVVEVNPEGKVTFVNDAALALLERVGRTGEVRALFPSDFRDLLDGLAGGSAALIEREVEVGGAFVLEGVQLLPARSTVRIYGVEITGLRSAEKALQESEERYRTLFETVPDGISLADPDGVIVMANAAAARLLGYPGADEMVGRRWFDFIAPAHRPAAAEALGRIASSGADSGAEYDFVRADGTLFKAAVKASVVPGPGGNPAGFVGVMRDMTEHDRLEDQLRQAQKLDAIGKLAGGVAHDFNNVLSVILSYAGFLLDELPAQSPLRNDAEEIKKAGERAAGLTRQLLAFSRKQAIQPRDISPNDAIAGLAKMLTRLIGEHVELGLKLSDRVGDVHLDPSQLEQIIINLAVNARDAMPGGGRLTIETGHAALDRGRLGTATDVDPGEYVMIAVSDNGTGIPADVLPRIFEPFFTTKEIGKGTGLGLSMVYGIVKQNGGHVEVESESGRGTTFRLFFKRMEPDSRDAGTTAGHATPCGRGVTILLVEDDAEVRRTTARMLESAGYVVVEAGGGEDGLALYSARKENVGLVITDVIMPGMGGAGFAKALKDRDPGVRILFISGYTDDVLGQQGILGPDVKLVNKPLEKRSFLKAVAEACADSSCVG